MRPRRSRRRGPRATIPALVVLACGLLVLAVAFGAGGTASFTTADAPRNTDLDVTADDAGALSLAVAPSVHINSTDTMVTVTNRLGQDVTVTVALRGDAEHIGDLVVDGTTVGNTTSFTLGEGGEQTVAIEIPDDSSLTDETVYFSVGASAPGLEVTAPDRNTPVNQ